MRKNPQTTVTSGAFFMYASILSAYFPNIAKYLPRILHIHLKLSVNSRNTQKEWRIRKKKFLLSRITDKKENEIFLIY